MALDQLTQRPVHTVLPTQTLAEAARLMCEHDVGALVVTDASRQTPLGIVTDRDLVWLVADGLHPEEATIDQFVRSPLKAVSVHEGLSDVTRKMREYGVRRLPIEDAEGRLIGLVSMDDVLVLLGHELADAAAAIEHELAHEHKIGETLRRRQTRRRRGAEPGGEGAGRSKAGKQRRVRKRTRSRAGRNRA
jgi:CBS domain-containing protein